jgi:hypothetical protein
VITSSTLPQLEGVPVVHVHVVALPTLPVPVRLMELPSGVFLSSVTPMLVQA